MNPQDLYTQASAAGHEAVKAAAVKPMIVTDEARNLQYFVEDGVCGFAWVKIRPARGAFINWCKKNNIGRVDSYEGGYRIWISEYNQSMGKKEAYARAFAKVLQDNGIKAYAMSRMD
jgi:hypothetical protein